MRSKTTRRSRPESMLASRRGGAGCDEEMSVGLLRMVHDLAH